METGSSSEPPKKPAMQKGTSKLGSLLPSVEPSVEPFVPRRDHSPRELRSWAKKTGFVSNFSGESVRESGQSEKKGGAGFDLEKGFDIKNGSPSPKIEIDPILGRTKNRGSEIESENGSGHGLSKDEANGGLRGRDERGATENQGRNVSELVLSKDDQKNSGLNGSGNGITNGSEREAARVAPASDPKKGDDGSINAEVEINLYPDAEEPSPGGWQRTSALKCGLRDNPGPGPLIYYGLQHYLSLAGSLVFIPLVIVPAMGGTDKDTATVISTMLLVTGITTILHSFFGTRLPLVQGSSFIFLAPALVIINSRDYRNLTEHKFRHIMRELQGAIIVGSIFQTIVGFSGFMSILLRLINPVVVAPTVAAVGLAFFNYGFPQAGTCVEISIPQVVLVLLFTLYLRGISIFGLQLFRIYAVPLSAVIIWAYAFFLTAGGAYNYKGCNPGIPSSNILTDACRKHAYTMKHCRTDVSNAWRTADWVRIPYPFQWGMPIFHLRTSIIMVVVALVASVESVGAYHSASLRVNLKPPTRGTVSRGIGMEGFCSILAGIWGTATGSTTLTENIYTIYITKVASRRAIELGAVFLIFVSFIGKIGAILASIPQALAASILCFVWALIVALGLSTLQYSQTASFRNIIIVGVSLFLGLSIPAYFQQYQPLSSLMLPSYFLPYSAASDGPFRSGSEQIDFAFNALLSMSMVVTFLLAVILDNTVPGSRQERGVYIWSSPDEIAADPSLVADYSPPRKIARFCRWARCLDF